MDYELLTQELLEYYANLLIVQYNGKSKASQTIKLLADMLIIGCLIFQIRDAFKLETAEGAQLDIIGKWVGISRFYDRQLFELRPWFALIDWEEGGDNLQGGFSTFDNFDTLEGGFLSYDNILPTQNRLDDSAFRWIIGLKIIKNSINHVRGEIDNAVWKHSDGAIYIEWTAHKLTYNYPSRLRELMLVAEYKNVLPCPIGCEIEIKEIIE